MDKKRKRKLDVTAKDEFEFFLGPRVRLDR
jgi:hypothetical protein